MKKIRKNGKALTKWDIACLVQEKNWYSHATGVYEWYTYRELCDWLWRVLDPIEREKIEWFDNIAPF